METCHKITIFFTAFNAGRRWLRDLKKPGSRLSQYPDGFRQNGSSEALIVRLVVAILGGDQKKRQGAT
jgi:hypothetical protein